MGVAAAAARLRRDALIPRGRCLRPSPAFVFSGPRVSGSPSPLPLGLRAGRGSFSASAEAVRSLPVRFVKLFSNYFNLMLDFSGPS